MDNLIFIGTKKYIVIEPMLPGCPSIALVQKLENEDANRYFYLNKASRKLSQPFHFADRVYNDGFAPVITEESFINGSGNVVTTRYIQYYNPAQDILLATKFDASHYHLWDDSPKYVSNLDPLYFRKTTVSPRIDWPLLISRDPINFYFVPTEKLQSKNFVRACKQALQYHLQYDNQSGLDDNGRLYDRYYHKRDIQKDWFIIPTTASGNNNGYQGLESYFANTTQVDDTYAAVYRDDYTAGIQKMFADKLAQAKAELEAQGKQCGDR